MKILGIDPGTSCGWALLDDDGSVAGFGTWDLSTKRHEGAGMRYLRLRRYLEEVVSGVVRGVELVAYEEVRRHLGTSAAHVYGGVISQVQAVCEHAKVPYIGLPVASVKKTATGRGNVGKPEMIAAALSKWGRAVYEDEADALWIAETARLQYGTERVA